MATVKDVPATRVLRSSPIIERSLAVLAIGAAIAFCYVVRQLLVPTVFALVLAFTVHPFVAWLERHKIPHPLAAIAGTLLATTAIALLVLVLYGGVQDFARDLPSYEDRLRETLGRISRGLFHLRAQTQQIEPPRQPGTVRVEEGVPWNALVLGTAQGALSLAAAAAVALFVLYFSLAEGPRYREKFLDHAGDDPSSRMRAHLALAELHRDVSQYMWNRILLNGVLGIVTWLSYALWLDHAAVLGLTTALLHFVPYLGPAIGITLPVLIAALQYGTLKHALVAGAVYVVLVSLQGNVVDPIFLGKQLKLSALAVFMGSLFFFWLWGPIGLFLAVPLLSTIRIVCKYLPRLRAVADFLAE